MKVVRIDIEFEDLDAGGVVHHPNYIKICERARTRWFGEFGITFSSLKNKEIAMVISSIKANYLRALRHEPVHVRMKIIEKTEKSLTVLHEISPIDTEKRTPFFSAEITLVAANISLGRSCPLPEEIVQFIESAIY